MEPSLVWKKAMHGATGPEQQQGQQQEQQQEQQKHKPDPDINEEEGQGQGHGQDGEEEEKEMVEAGLPLSVFEPSHLIANNNHSQHDTCNSDNRNVVQDSERTLNLVLDVLGSPPVHIALGMGIAFVMYQLWNMFRAR
jgi:hypothetical protein